MSVRRAQAPRAGARRATLLCCVAAALAVSASRAEDPKPPARPGNDMIRQGASVMRLLQSGRYDGILDQMHYPPDYTPEQIATDRRAIAAGIQYAMTQLGKLESFELELEPVETRWVSLSMGTPEYWSERDILGMVAFATRHAKLESGLLRISVARIGDKDGIRSLDFGIPTSVAGSKQRIERMGAGVARRMTSATGGRQEAPNAR